MRLYAVEVSEQTLDKIERKHGITIDEINRRLSIEANNAAPRARGFA